MSTESENPTLSSSIDDTFTFSTVHESNKYELYCSEKNGWSCKTTLINPDEYFNNQKNKPNGIVGLDENGLINSELISNDIARVEDINIPYIDLVEFFGFINAGYGGGYSYSSSLPDAFIKATNSEFVKFNVSIKDGDRVINRDVVANTNYISSSDKYIYAFVLVDEFKIYSVNIDISLSMKLISLSTNIIPNKNYVDSSINTAKNEVKNELLNGAGAAYDSLRELGDLIDDNTDAIEALEKIASGKADKTHTHDDRYYTESEIDEKFSTTNKSISDITSGTTVVEEARHATNADSATFATSSTKAGQDASGNVITETYETKNNANNKLTEAKKYTDEQFAKVNEPTLLNLAIKPTTDPATSLHIQDSAKYRVLDMSMQGKTEQYKTEGNQLFDISTSKGFESLYTGLSCVIDVEHRTITTTNTHTSDRTGFLDLGVLKAGSYFIAFENVNGYEINPNIYYGELETEVKKIKDISLNGGVFTLTEDTHCWLVWVVRTDNPLKIKNLMLNSGTTAKPFEPYTGGIPSPNKDYPQEITHAGRYNEETGRYEVDVEVCNKNFYKPTIFSTHQCTARLEKDKYIFENTETTGVVVVKNELLTLKKGITYRLSLHDVVNVDRVIVWENGDVNKPLGDARATYTFTCTPTENMKIRCGIYMKDISIIGNVAECRIQIEQGTTATPYIPHESQKVTLTSSRELTKWDKLEKRNGVYGWVYKGVKYVLDDTNEWWEYPNYEYNGFLCKIPFPFKAWRRQGYCNQLIANVEHSDGMWIGASNNVFYVIYSRFYDTSLADKGLANWKAHLKEHPLEVWTYLDTEEFEPLQEAEQAALEALETYYGVTNITNSEECMMQIQYVADTKLYVDNKFTALATQIV